MSQTIAPNAPLPGIEHIVVVMFENRSFDNVLGTLYPPSDTFNGLPLDSANTFTDGFDQYTVGVTNVPPSGNDLDITPNPDPGESQSDMSQQIYNGASSPNMGGFAQNYHDEHALHSHEDVGDVMCYFDQSATPPQMLVSAVLGSSCAVSDQWFGSGPVQTFPNRMFSLCATPGAFGGVAAINDINYVGEGSGYSGALGSVTDKTVLKLLDDASGATSPDPTNWKVYFHDVPLSALSSYVNGAWNAGSACVSSYDGSDYDPPYGTTLATDVSNNALPAFAIIEPRYWGNYSTDGTIANSNHPGNDDWHDAGASGNPINVQNGEDLLVDIFQTLFLTNDTVANSTLLIVLYDEHGGVYDHQAPGAALSPFGSGVTNGSVYDIFGPRVPAIFVAASIAQNTVLRPPSSSTYPSTTPPSSPRSPRSSASAARSPRATATPPCWRISFPRPRLRDAWTSICRAACARTRAETGTAKDARRPPAHDRAMGPRQGRETAKDDLTGQTTGVAV
jgi:phospholipase C